MNRSPIDRMARFGCALAVSFVTAQIACGPPSAARPNVVLIVIDTLRADHLGAYGYPRPTSPNIDQLAESGWRFTNATAASSWTKPSVASLFTSRHPSEHGAVSFDRDLSPSLPTLPAIFASAGYRTVGVSGNFVHIAERTGFARGFDHFETLGFAVERPGEDTLLSMPSDAGGTAFLRAASGVEINRRVLDLLPDGDERPLFIYVHYMEPHPGYSPPEPERSAFVTDAAAHARGEPATSAYLSELAGARTPVADSERQRLIDLYDAEIASVDRAIGDLVSSLTERGLLDETVLVVTSDHGEEFGDHGGWFHGLNLQPESVHVPIVIHDARAPGPGAVREDAVDLLDLTTTLIRLAGADPPDSMRGRDLLADTLPERDLVAELHPDPLFEDHVRPRSQGLALTRWPWRATVESDGAHVFYRLDRDPRQLQPAEEDLAELPTDLPEALEALLLRRRASIDDGSGSDLDDEAREGLRALGYVE